jgi:hypothetical protein
VDHIAVNWTVEQLATVLARLKVEPRKNLKRYLKDQGGRGSAEELDLVIAEALANSQAKDLSEQIAAERAMQSRDINDGLEDQIDVWRDEIKRLIESRKMSLGELSTVCGYTVDYVTSMLNGSQRPSVEQLAKIAIALQCSWRLVEDED